MAPTSVQSLQQFNSHVGIKFQLYNSLFTSLPFHRVEKTGIFLSLLLHHCEEGYRRKQNPSEIIEGFFSQYTTLSKDGEKVDLLFRFIQYIERQVVLFDALEDAAFRQMNDMQGPGTVKQLLEEAKSSGKEEALTACLSKFAVRLVLTAHPTQFYPGPVLGIIHDLSKALAANNTGQVNTLLQQLGKTPFLKREKPTPYDEAVSLIWYLENVFYPAAGKVLMLFREVLPLEPGRFHSPVAMGFWPGGDKDGNPFVTPEITLQVAAALRSAILKCYYLDIRRLKRRLTFAGVDTLVAELEAVIYEHCFLPEAGASISVDAILNTLFKIRQLLVSEHNCLFLSEVEELIYKVQAFGLHFASLDVRQSSTIISKTALQVLGEDQYEALPEEERLRFLQTKVVPAASGPMAEESLDLLQSLQVIKQIQERGGELACNRFIISQCNRASQMMELYTLFLAAGWEETALTVDFIPLFESVEDLANSASIMEQLFTDDRYRAHLERRGRQQTIMVGFSDGTKDGGYLMSNWSIYKAKAGLTALALRYGVEVLFFDGRGGPPARGGGKTHKFYASMKKEIAQEEIQLTVQGQTVSTNFGTVDAAQYNLEQLLHAGVSKILFSSERETLAAEEAPLLEELAAASYQSYKGLKEHPCFLEYLQEVSPLPYYSDANISSRPSQRNKKGSLSLDNLRAIPFVGAWSQLKQNVSGFYGVGTALKALDEGGRFAEVTKIYQQSLFFKTLMDNCEMAMKKCYFPLTAYLSDHSKYGGLWQLIHAEYGLTSHYLSKLKRGGELMADYPVEAQSIQMRERIVLPLTTIQQYALMMLRAIREEKADGALAPVMEKLVIRSSFGIINAGRNSV